VVAGGEESNRRLRPPTASATSCFGRPAPPSPCTDRHHDTSFHRPCKLCPVTTRRVGAGPVPAATYGPGNVPGERRSEPHAPLRPPFAAVCRTVRKVGQGVLERTGGKHPTTRSAMPATRSRADGIGPLSSPRRSQDRPRLSGLRYLCPPPLTGSHRLAGCRALSTPTPPVRPRTRSTQASEARKTVGQPAGGRPRRGRRSHC